jgi:DNA-binding response OmpR family regulator
MPYTILYIEDETAIIELAHDILAHPDVRLVSTSKVEQGLVWLRELKPDLLLLDVLMPGRSGWSVYEEVRAHHEFHSLPIIMLTGQLHRYRVMKDFERSLIDAYITKPFDVSTVRGEIEKMLGVLLWSKKQPDAQKAAAVTVKSGAAGAPAGDERGPSGTAELGPDPDQTDKPEPTA